jgi:large subunit ribosomal protein L4
LFTLPEAVFSAPWNPELVHQVAVAERSNARPAIAHTKDKGEVSGGGKKPWKQKHTGRARHGSTRSPIWIGGGVTFGPRHDRSFSKKINKAMRRAALVSVVSKKFADGELRVVDSLIPESPKTKFFAAGIFKVLGTTKSVNVLCVVPSKSSAAFRAGKNIAGTEMVSPEQVSTLGCLSHRYLVFDRAALELFIAAHEAPRRHA